MSTEIRRATPEDAEALVAAAVLAFEYDSVLYPEIPVGGPPGYNSLNQMHRNISRNDTYTISADGSIVGGMVVYVDGLTHCHLDLLFIAPDYHNRGIGTQAIRFLESTYPSATRWTLDTPIWAVRNRYFYEKHGYLAFGEQVNEDITLIMYEKRL